MSWLQAPKPRRASCEWSYSSEGHSHWAVPRRWGKTRRLKQLEKRYSQSQHDKPSIRFGCNTDNLRFGAVAIRLSSSELMALTKSRSHKLSCSAMITHGRQLASLDKSGSSSGHTKMNELGNPTIPNIGISKLFNESDQRVWFTKCPRCSKWLHLDWFENFVFKNDKGVYLPK